MSENGEIYTAGKKFYTAAGTDGMDKFHICGYIPEKNQPGTMKNNGNQPNPTKNMKQPWKTMEINQKP